MSKHTADGLSDVSAHSVVTFLTDFGREGGYVAACEAVILSIAPGARIVHVSHEVAVGDLRHAALTLRRIAPLCPIAVHLAVVDPGVGTARRPLALLAARGDVLIGPDNGLLLPAAESLGGTREAWALEPSLVRSLAGLPTTDFSSTFHGRDIFAPAAGLTLKGMDPSSLGSPLDRKSLVTLPAPHWHSTDSGVSAEVVEIDRFGNVELAAPFDALALPGSTLLVEVEGEGLPFWNARVVHTFGQLNPGELGVFRDSWGYVALALNGASAAQLLTVERGMSVCVAVSEDIDEIQPES